MGNVNEGLVEGRRVSDGPLRRAIDEGTSQVPEGNKHEWRVVNRREGKQPLTAGTEDHLKYLAANSSRMNKGSFIRQGG